MICLNTQRSPVLWLTPCQSSAVWNNYHNTTGGKLFSLVDKIILTYIHSSIFRNIEIIIWSKLAIGFFGCTIFLFLFFQSEQKKSVGLQRPRFPSPRGPPRLFRPVGPRSLRGAPPPSPLFMRPPVIRLNDPSLPVSLGPRPARSEPVTKVRPIPPPALVLGSQPNNTLAKLAVLEEMDVSVSGSVKRLMVKQLRF